MEKESERTIERYYKAIFVENQDINYLDTRGGKIPRLHDNLQYPRVVKLLLLWGADPDTPSLETGNTALMEATMSTTLSRNSAEILLQAGANYNIVNKFSECAMYLALNMIEGKYMIALLIKYGDHMKPGTVRGWHYNRDYANLLETLLLFCRPLVVKRLRGGKCVLPVELVQKLKECFESTIHNRGKHDDDSIF